MLREFKIFYICISLTLLATVSLAADFGDNSNPLTQTQISQLYVSIFGRASEGEGNAYWQSEQSDMTVAANTMLNTEPAKAYFGDTLNDNQMFIEFIYKNTLGKDYAEDPGGVNYWVSELSGGKSKGEVVATLINAAIDPQYAGLAAQDQFLNKVEVSNYTAETITTVPDVNDLSAFVNFISDVTDDPATVVAAKDAVRATFDSDTTAPQLTSFSFTPTSVDVSNQGQVINFSGRATDDISGVNYFLVQLRGPSGIQYAEAFASSPTTGDARDGVYTLSTIIPKYAEVGTWYIQRIELYDALGNGPVLYENDLISMGFLTKIEVIN